MPALFLGVGWGGGTASENRVGDELATIEEYLGTTDLFPARSSQGELNTICIYDIAVGPSGPINVEEGRRKGVHDA